MSMKILHYSLGYPPNRSGGLVKYAVDLIREQAIQGHQVVSLYPGRINLLRRTPYIKEDLKKTDKNINVYELYNSLPLPLFGGIKSPNDFMVSVSSKIYTDFLTLIRPDVIHIHTLMGIHKEFFESAKQLNIKIIYTTHDYFGLAPEPNFFANGESYDDENTAENWAKASRKAMSTNKLRLFQFSQYGLLRSLLNNLRMRKNKAINGNDSEEDTVSVGNIEEYKKLKKFYFSIFQLIDKFHYNSTISKEVFTKNILEIKEDNQKIISITNTSISKHKMEKMEREKKRIAYIGPYKEYKGYYEFLKLPEILGTKKFEYRTYGDTKSVKNSNIVNYNRYTSDEITEVYKEIDILFVPSKWKETFGFVVLEALSYGKYVVVHSNVGAKDLVAPSCVYSDIKDVQKIVDNLEQFKLSVKIKCIDEHVKEVINFYK